MSMPHDPFSWLALGGAALATPILLWFLLRQPQLIRSTKIILLFGIGVFPIITATGGNIAGYEATKTRRFCGSCHVMTPYAQDSEDRESTSLAARHARNEAFGHENCYACHADYGMFGTVTTKIGGMRHVYEYAFNFRQLSIEEALPRIHLLRPFQNSSCMRCHSTEGPSWQSVGDHASSAEDVRMGKVSCASEGCHGAAHPFSKPYHAKAKADAEEEEAAP
jgi:cytochrome c-type protein NapC